MRKLFIFILFLAVAFNGNAQNKFGCTEITDENRAEAVKAMEKIPEFKLRTSYIKAKTERPSFVDNSKQKYFPPIVSQIGGSCGCASMVHYIYTYEMNYLLDRDGKNLQNIANYMYIWNFINEGVGKGTFPWDVNDAIHAYGFMPNSIYSTMSITEWPNGFDKYREAFNYSLENSYKFNSENPEHLEAMKQYLWNHADGSDIGGLIQFSGYADPLDATIYNGPGSENCKAIIPEFGTDGMHSMTIVGYDDNVWWDYNENKVQDPDEMGAFLCVNSWGDTWGDKGFFYAPYRTFSSKMFQGHGGIGNGGVKECYVIVPATQSHDLYFKLILRHSSRNDLSLNVGALDDEGQVIKEFSKEVFKQHGGDVYIRGIRGSEKEILEFGIDASELSGVDASSYYVEICNRKVGKAGEGEILYCSMLDYRNTSDKPMEYIAEVSDKEIKGNTNKKAVVSTFLRTKNDESVEIKYVNINKQLHLNFICMEKSYISIDLLDTESEFITTIIDKEMEKGFHCDKINMGNKVPLGEYVLRINTSNKLQYKKIMIK